MMMIVTIQMIGAAVKMMINRPYSGHSEQEAFHGAGPFHFDAHNQH